MELLRRFKTEREKAGLQLNIHKTKVMSSAPLDCFELDGESVEVVDDFQFFDSCLDKQGS
jgi:hypothetical protein